MSKPLTMTDERLAAIRFVLGREPEHVQKNAKALMAEVDALRAALADAEDKLAEERKHADALRACMPSEKVIRECEPEGHDNDPLWPGRKHPCTIPAKLILAFDAARRAARDGQEGTR